MLEAIVIFAQVPVDPAPYAGWTSAGLLALVLTWLLGKHLPDKDKQIRDFLIDKDKQFNEIMIAHREEREVDRNLRHQMASAFTDAWLKRDDKLTAAINEQTVEIRTALQRPNNHKDTHD